MAKPRKTTEGFADGSAHLVHATLDAPYRMYVLRRLGLDVLQVNARSMDEAIAKARAELGVTEERLRDEYTLELKHA